ncbi:replication-relaxation family protein [Ureibacillus composti]
MSSEYPFGLSEKEIQILLCIYPYRGLRACDVAVFLHKSFRYSLSQEKSVYNYLLKLKKKCLIKQTRLQEVGSLGSLYYLTNNGLEVMKEILNIKIGQDGNGLLPINNETTFWDIPTEYQQPPLKQNAHFLTTIEFFKVLIADQSAPFIHLTTHYSNLVYYKDNRRHKVKPDATVIVGNSRYAVEIDRATESHVQLVQKFQKYKEHYDYCQQVEDKSKVSPVHSILFVVEARTRRHGIQRRWTNVLSAFFEVFGQDFPEINFIMVPLNEVTQTLNFEANRKNFEEQAYNELLMLYKEKGFEPFGTVDGYTVAVNHEQKKCKVMMIQVHQEFESRLYKDKYELAKFIVNCKGHVTNTPELMDYEYLHGSGVWWSPFNVPKYAEGIDKTKLNQVFLQKMNVAKYYFDFYRENKFNMPTNSTKGI